ncbi:hypothetical protein WMY93_022264 [Mugilogobius chulae]|uniref:Uncharacterized protein n=1 Tax=Mugilogobius chulae TaxID=88201 RepID=A0AAW0NGM3_9GOBI
MPKKDKSKVSSAAVAKAAEASGPVTKDKNGAVTVSVHAKPGAKLSAITEVSAEAVGVALQRPLQTERPTLSSSGFCLKSWASRRGSRSRDKLIKLESSLSPEEVLQKLKQAVS